MSTNILNDKFLEQASDKLVEVVNQASMDVIYVIVDRMKEIGELSPEEVSTMIQSARLADMRKIEKILEQLLADSPELINEIVEQVAEGNEKVALKFYEHAGVEQVPHAESRVMSEIITSATRNAEAEFLNIMNTAAFNIRGNVMSIRAAYINAVDKSAFAVQQGLTDYNSAIRRTVRDLARSGLQTVDYASGYSRRLDSSVRMNILDGMRQMSISMREQQAKEFGADGWQISAHALCRPSHQPYQGRIFSLEEFERINENELASNPIATGQYNCHHTRFGVIMDISGDTYQDDELKELIALSNKEVEFTGLDGEPRVMTRYEASQVQRQKETNLRRLIDQRNALKAVGDDIGATALNNSIAVQLEYYKQISKEIGLKPKLDRVFI